MQGAVDRMKFREDVAVTVVRKGVPVVKAEDSTPTRKVVRRGPVTLIVQTKEHKEE